MIDQKDKLNIKNTYSKKTLLVECLAKESKTITKRYGFHFSGPLGSYFEILKNYLIKFTVPLIFIKLLAKSLYCIL